MNHQTSHRRHHRHHRLHHQIGPRLDSFFRHHGPPPHCIIVAALINAVVLDFRLAFLLASSSLSLSWLLGFPDHRFPPHHFYHHRHHRQSHSLELLGFPPGVR